MSQTTQYQIQVWSERDKKFVPAPAPLGEFMTTQLIKADLWFPTERVQVVAVRG